MIYTVENKFLRIEVNSLGAQLFSVRSKKTGVEYLWQGDPAYWTGRAYNLFPIIGRMVDGKYTYGENTYSIRAHGLARYYEFSAADRSATRLSLRLSSTEETLSQYPFAFDFTVTFQLKNNALYITYSVKNKGTETMPFAFGGHPGINVPFDGGNFEDYYLEF